MAAAMVMYSWFWRIITPFVKLRYLLSELLEAEAVNNLESHRHANSWRERFGYSSSPRPSGALIWFHAASLGESMEAVPLARKCLEEMPEVNILITTVTASALSVLLKTVPEEVICQFAPLDTPAAVERFHAHWEPQAAVFVESELWPNLIRATWTKRIPLALINAKMSSRSYSRWNLPPGRELIKNMISRFDVIFPIDNNEAVRFQSLGAQPHQIIFGGNLKYASGAMNFSSVDESVYNDLREQIGNRTGVWLAASIHPGEETVVLSVHNRLKLLFRDLLTIIVPRHPEHGAEIKVTAVEAITRRTGPSTNERLDQVSRRSFNEPVLASTEVYIADTLGELGVFYKVVNIAFIGGSLLEGLQGHNIAEPALAGCAVITGCNVGHFQGMIGEMLAHSPLAVEQVSSEDELFCFVRQLLEDRDVLSKRRQAAQVAVKTAGANVVNAMFSLLRTTVLERVWRETKQR